MNRKKGHVLVMTVLIMAIACIWFSLALAVSGNYFRVSRDEINLVQNRALAQGAMQEAMVILERAAAEGTLDAQAPVVVKRQVEAAGLEGELAAAWRWRAKDELVIEASGVTDTGKSAVTGYFTLAKLPLSAGAERPILLVESTKAKTLLADNGYDHLLKDDHAGGLTLNQTEPLSGGLYCLGNGQDDWTVTVRKLDLSEDTLFIQGHLNVTGSLQALKLYVMGDLHIEEGGALSCPEIWIGGDISGEGASEERYGHAQAPEFKNVLVIRKMRN